MTSSPTPSESSSSSPTSPLTFSSHTFLLDDDARYAYDMPPPSSEAPSRTASRASNRRDRDRDRESAPATPALPALNDRSPTPPILPGPSTTTRQVKYNGTHAASASTSTLRPPGSPLVRSPIGPRMPSISRRSPAVDAGPGIGQTDVSSVRRMAAANASSSSLTGSKEGLTKNAPERKRKRAPRERATTTHEDNPTSSAPARDRSGARERHVLEQGALSRSWTTSRGSLAGATTKTVGRTSGASTSVRLASLPVPFPLSCVDATGFSETMQWTRPEMQGDLPPACRAHTATVIDRSRIVFFGGGVGTDYYQSIWILDTQMRRWLRPEFDAEKPLPEPRRAHTAVLYKDKVWVFGGGNGTVALNDTWTLDVSNNLSNLKWEQVAVSRRKPSPRGYHTATLVGNMMIVIGGSDGREAFEDVWCLDLDKRQWQELRLETTHKRLSHSVTQVGSYLFITGGHNGDDYTSELLMFNLVSLQFEPRRTLGRPHTPRGYHATVLADSRLFVFGGFNGRDIFEDVYILDLAAAAYLPQVTSFRIET
ncbi:hypothetical protein EW146_g3323 [Bondarzewia mesenterica]|uniref:Galactose oxidase n=1 Tax=Bondarzewia mesenterica TaxID=1095465 RepID=A0A4S4LXX1_9AGAM|nr:hypothetical protein EW146_g3323 [Bondarzewia mesenterica]